MLQQACIDYIYKINMQVDFAAASVPSVIIMCPPYIAQTVGHVKIWHQRKTMICCCCFLRRRKIHKFCFCQIIPLLRFPPKNLNLPVRHFYIQFLSTNWLIYRLGLIDIFADGIWHQRKTVIYTVVIHYDIILMF